MTHRFWSNGTFIDQFILICKSDHDLSFITLKKTLSQCALKANCISEQTKAIGEMEKTKSKPHDFFFFNTLLAWRALLFVYLLLLKLISPVQKGLNIATYLQ